MGSEKPRAVPGLAPPAAEFGPLASARRRPMPMRLVRLAVTIAVVAASSQTEPGGPCAGAPHGPHALPRVNPPSLARGVVAPIPHPRPTAPSPLPVTVCSAEGAGGGLRHSGSAAGSHWPPCSHAAEAAPANCSRLEPCLGHRGGAARRPEASRTPMHSAYGSVLIPSSGPQARGGPQA